MAKNIDSANQTSDQTSGLGTLGDLIPQENREQLESLAEGTVSTFSRVRGYVSANPLATAGIAILAGAAIWALFGSNRARVMAAGKSLLEPVTSRLQSDDDSANVVH